MSERRPPSANSAAREMRYPLITHWTPVEDSPSSCWMFGIAIDTIV